MSLPLPAAQPVGPSGGWWSSPRSAPQRTSSRAESTSTAVLPFDETVIDLTDRVQAGLAQVLDRVMADRFVRPAWSDGRRPSSDPEREEAARTLGLDPAAPQSEVDARFRALVKQLRPDLGALDPDTLAAIRDARRTLVDRARRDRSSATRRRFSLTADDDDRGGVIDLRG